MALIQKERKKEEEEDERTYSPTAKKDYDALLSQTLFLPQNRIEHRALLFFFFFFLMMMTRLAVIRITFDSQLTDSSGTHWRLERVEIVLMP